MVYSEHVIYVLFPQKKKKITKIWAVFHSVDTSFLSSIFILHRIYMKNILYVSQIAPHVNNTLWLQGVQDLSDSHPMNHLKCCHFDLVDLYVGFSCYSFNNNLSKKMQIGSQNSIRKSVQIFSHCEQFLSCHA